MTTDWLSIALSIPIGIATALVTPWIQRRLEERGKQRSLERTKNMLAEFEEVARLKGNPTELTHYLVHVTLKTTFIAAVMGAVSGASFIIGRVLSSAGGNYDELLSLMGQIVALVGSVMVVNTCRPALLTYIRIRNFDEYSESVTAMTRGQEPPRPLD